MYKTFVRAHLDYADVIYHIPDTIYNIHDPSGLTFLFHLSVCLTLLKYHKKRYSFLDIADDRCIGGNSPEKLAHFMPIIG